MDGVIILAALVLNPRARRLRRLQAEPTVIHDSGHSIEPSIPSSSIVGEAKEREKAA